MIIPPFLIHYKKKVNKKCLFFLCLLWGVLNGNAQTISITGSIPNKCFGQQLVVKFTKTGSPSTPLFVELSSNGGSFSTVNTIGTQVTPFPDSIIATIPSSTPNGTNYRIRIRSSTTVIYSDTSNFFIIGKPTPFFTFTNNPCAGTNVTFTNSSSGNSILSYSWNFSATAGSPSSPNTNVSPTVQFNPANGSGTVNYTIILTATDSLGCANTANNTITVRQKPTPTFTIVNNNTCAGTNVSFTNSSTGNGSLSYSWNFSTTTGAPSSPNTSPTPTVQFNPASGGGTIYYLITLTVTDGNGCINSANSIDSVKQRPDARTFAAILTGNFTNVPTGTNPDTIRKCNNITPFLLTLSNSSSTSSSNNSYNINWGDLSANTNSTTFSSNISHTYSNLGEYILNLTVGNSLGCTSSKLIYTYIGTNPSIGLGNPGNTTGECIIKTYTFPITSFSTNSPGTRYLITSNDLGFDTSYIHPPPSSYTKTYLQNSCGFTSLGSYQNSFHVRIRAVNACASSSATVEPIQLSSKPSADFTFNNPVCSLTNVTFTNTSGNGRFVDPSPPNACDTSSFPEWEINPSTGWTLVSGTLVSAPNATNIVNINFSVPGVYSVKLRIKGTSYLLDPSFTCGLDSTTKTICVQPTPIPNFTYAGSQSNRCANDTVRITNTSNTLSSCGNTTYNWVIIDSLTNAVLTPSARFSYVFPTTNNSINPVFLFTQAGIYKIRLQVTNSCATVNKDTFIIIKDKPFVSLPSIKVYCDSQNIVFSSSNVNHNPIINTNYGTISSYSWSVSPSGFSFTNGNANSTNPTISFPNTGTTPITYTVTFSATNECGVSNIASQQITINPKPIVNATSSPANSAFCSGGSTNIVLTNNLPSGVNYTWRAYVSSVNIIGATNQLTGVSGPIVQQLFNIGNTTQTVTYRIVGRQTSASCSGDSISVVITVYPIPRVIATSQTICSGSATNLVLASTVSPSLFTWTTATTGATTGFSNQTTAITGPIAQTLTNNSTVTDTVRYTIRAIANGCNSLDSIIKVAVKPISQISNTVITQSICSGVTASFTPTSTVLGSTFSYTASLFSGVATGFSSGNGNVSQTLFNTGLTNAIVRYAYTPSGGGTPNCIGSVVNFDVTVKPIPSASANPTTAFLCSGAQTNIVLTPTISGTLYTWTAVLTSGTSTIGFSSDTIPRTGPIAQTITNSSTANAIVTYTITPVLNGCVGATFTSVITVYPGTTPGTVGTAATVCSGSNSGTLTLTGSTGNVVRWESSVSPFSTWNNITNTLTTQNYLNLTQSTRYRAVVQSGTGGSCSQVATNAVLITVDSITIAGNLTGTDTVCTSINTGVITLNNRRGNIVNWQSSVNLSSWSNIGTTTVNPYTFTNLTQTTWFRVSVKNGVCPLINSDSVRIQVDALPSAAIAPNKQVCATSLSTGVNDNLVANTITSGTGLWSYISGPNSPTIVSPTNTTTVINNLAIGTHLIQWTVSNGKCPANKDTLYFTVYSPLVSTISANQTICSGQIPNQLTGTTPTGGNGIYTYQWQQSNDGVNWINITGDTLASFSPGSLTTNTYYRKMVTSGNCIVPSNTILITIVPIIVNAISNNASICIGATAPIIGNSVATGGNGTYSYQWQRFNGSAWVNTASVDTFSNYNPGIILNTISYRRLVNSGPCISTSNTVTITVNPLPIVNAGGDSSKCQNQLTYTLNGSPTGGTWSGVGVSSNTFNPSAMPLGNYSLVYTYTNSNGCTNRDTAIISVIAPPTVNAGNDFSICENAPAIQLTGTTPTSGGSWSGTAVTPGGLFNPTTAGAGVFKLYYSFTAGTGCGGLDSLYVTVNPKPNSNFTIPAQICPINSTVLTTTTNSSATIAGYNWTVTNSGTFSNNILSSYNTASPTATFPENKTVNDTTYTIRLITTTNYGCIDTVIKTIILRRRPLAQFTTGSNINCGPALYSITNATSNVTSSYLWSTNPNTFVNINTTTSTAPQITFPVNNSTAALIYNIRLIATRNDGQASCADTTNASITVYPKPIIGFTSSPNDSGCSPLSINFSNTSNPQNTENINTMSFLWNFGLYGNDTARNTQRIFTNTSIIDSITNVKVIGTTAWGCKDSLTKIIKVYPFPKADFISSIYSSCSPFLINNSVITLTQYPVANDLYTWQILNKNGTINSSSTGTTIPSFTITTPNDTVYYRLITSHTRGCKADTLTRMFITIANPQSNFTMSDSVGCTPLTVNFTNTSTVGVTSAWTISNGVIPANNNPFGIVFNNLSNMVNAAYTAKLVITAGSGCKDSITKNITVYPKPKANFTLAPNACSQSSLSPSNSSAFKGSSANYGWKIIENTATIINDTNAANPLFTFINNQGNTDSIFSFRLRVTSVDGCIHDTIKPITIYRRPLANFTVPPTFCGPANVAITNTTNITLSSWSWLSTPTLNFNTATSQNPIVTFPLNSGNDSINYRLSLTATRNGTTCIDTISKLVTIYPKPQALFNTVTQDSCGPRLVNFTNTSNAKNGESLASMGYLWSYLNNNISTINATGTYTNTGVIDSTYNTRLIATSMHGCKDTANTIVTVRPNAKASFTYSIATSCAPFIINSLNIITNVYTSANFNYNWYVNNNLIGTGSTFPGYTISNANDSVLIKLVTTSISGCKNDSMEVWFRTIPNPVPNFTISDSIGCSPLTVNFTNTSTVGVTSAWTISNGAIPANTNPFGILFNNLSNTTNATYTAKLVITAGSGCKDSITKNITVYPKPKAIFSLPNNICADSFKTATNNSIYKTPNVTYGWKFITTTNNTINDTTLATPTFSFINNQTGVDSNYTIRLRVISVDGCFHDTTKNVTIYKRPLAIFTFPTTYCGPTNITISNSTVLNSTWLWSSNPSLGFTTNTSQNPIVLFPQNSTNDSINYRILLTATRVGTTCTDTSSRITTIYPKPQALFSILTQDSCGPRLVKFTNTSNAKNGESLASMYYLWSFLNNNISTKDTSGIFTNSLINDSNYNVRLIATSKHGCKDTSNTNVKVWPNAKASFTYSTATSCAPFSITSLNIISNVYPNANLNYKWYANNNLIGITSTFPGYTLSTANDSVLIKLVTISKNGCKDDSIQVWFRTIPNPVPNFTMSDSVGCTPLTVNFTNTSTIGVVSAWAMSNGVIPSSTNPFTIVFNNLLNVRDTIFTAKLVITAGSGCKDSITKNITVYPKPKANFTLAPNACSQSSLSPSNSSIFKGSSANYGWKIIENTATIINDTNAANPIFTFINNQGNTDSIFSFRLRVTSVDGCIHDTIKPITIYRRPLANFTVPPTFCGPANVAITNTTNITLSSWSWLSTPTLNFNTATSQNPIVTFPLNSSNDSINYRLSLTATRNGTTCIDTISKLVTIYPKPQALFNTVTQDSCGPRLVNFTNTSNAKNGESLASMGYLWTYLNNNISTINATGTYTNTGVIDSTYNTRLIATSMHGCKDTANTTVSVKPNAKAVFTSILNLSCAPFNITATNVQAVNYSNTNSTYQWFANNIPIGNGITFPGYTIANQNDSVLIKLKTISLNNCKNDSMQVWFRTIANPVPNFLAIDSIGCSPLLVNFNNTSTPNNGLSYRWEFGSNTNQSVLKFPTFTFYNYGIIDTTVLVKLVITAGGTGCSDSITKPIIIKPLPRPIINLSDSVLCFPNTLNVTNLSNSTPALNMTGFKWKVVGPDLATILNDTSSSNTTISFPDNKSGLNKIYQIRLITRSIYGCVDSTQKVLRIPTRPIASFNFSADSACAPVIISSNNTSSYALTFSWTSLKPNVTINNPSLINTSFIFPSHKGTVDSIYPIKLITQTIAGCFDTITKPFKVFPLPIANFTSDKDSGCSSLTVKFYNSTIVKKPTSYFWNYGDGNSQINNADTITKSFVGSIYQDTTYIVKLVTTSANGCKDSTTKSINVKAGAYAKIKLTDTIICSNSVNPTKLNIQNKSYGSVDTFYWDFGDGTQLISTVDSNINHPYLNEGHYTIVLKATNSCRTSFDTAKIEVQTPPNVNFTKSDSIGCSPLSVSFTNLSTNVYKAKFLWTFGNGSTNNLFTPPTINYLQSRTTDTTYYMNLRVSNVCGVFQKNDSIKVLPKPIAIFLMSADSGCSPLPVFMINQSVGLPISYKWYFGNGDSSLRFAPLQNPITYTTIDTISYFKIKLIATNTCGIDSTEKTIKIFPNTVNSFFTTSGNSGCEGLIVRFYDNSTGGNNISYNFGDGNTSLLPNPIHQYNTPGTYYAYQYVNNGCSFDTSFVIVSVLPKPNFSISKAAPNICIKSPIQFNANVLDSGAITWYFGDGDSSNAFNPIHIYNSAGKKYITVLLKSFYNSCVSIKYDSIIVSPIPVITLIADTNQACAYHLFKFNASSPQTNLFNWDFGDNNTGAGTSLTHLYKFGGTYSVKIVALTLLGCIDSATKLITVFPVPISDFSYTPKDTCTGPVNVNFTNLSVGATNYLWDFGNGNTSTNVNPSNIYTNVGSYPIKLISSNQFSCYDTSNSKYFVYQTPKASLDFDPDKGCPPLEVAFENKSTFGNSYLWEFGDGQTDTSFSPKHTYLVSGKYKVKLTVKAGSVCFDTITAAKLVTVFAKPTSIFDTLIDRFVKPYGKIEFINKSVDATNYLWIYGDGFESKEKDPSYKYKRAGTFQILLIAYSKDNCVDSSFKKIEIPEYYSGLYVPNAFTPEYGTDEVRIFKPSGLELKYYHLKIFSKWGELLWESDALNNGQPKDGWNGIDSKGNKCIQGSYIWTIEAEFTDGSIWKGMKYPNSSKEETRGNVTLIR